MSVPRQPDLPLVKACAARSTRARHRTRTCCSWPAAPWGRDEHGDRAALVRLVQSSRRLAGRAGEVDDEPVAEDEARGHTH